MKFLCTLLLLVLAGTHLRAQNSIAQLKFEDAEKAFNEGDYAKALHYVAETENLVGLTSKTLYLKIVAQDGLMTADPSKRSELLAALKTNVQKYLTALKDQEIDDKYRKVYAISKKLQGNRPQGASSGNNRSQGAASLSSGSTTAVLQAYKKAIWGQLDPQSVRSVVMEQETFNGSTLVSSMQIKVMEGKLYIGVNMGAVVMKSVYRDGNGYVSMGSGFKVPMSGTTVEAWRKATEAGHLLPRQFDSDAFSNATVHQETYDGVPADVLVLPDKALYFSRSTHLLIAQEMTDSSGSTVTERYQDYRNVDGVQFPFTVVKTFLEGAGSPHLSEIMPKQENRTESQAPAGAAIGLVGSRRKSEKRQRTRKKQELATMASAVMSANQPEAPVLAGTQADQKGTAAARAFQRVVPQSQPLAGQTGIPTTTTTKTKSLVINQPLSDEIFK